MQKTLSLALALILAAVAVSARPPGSNGQEGGCRLLAPRFPAVRGIRLGMTAAELLALFPGVSSDSAKLRGRLEGDKGPPHYGVADINFTPSDYREAKGFSGVNHISARLLDGRVTSFSIRYDGPGQLYPWKHVDQLIEKIAQAYNLPGPAAWSPHDATQTRELRCEGVTVRASVADSCCPYITVESPFPKQLVEERRRVAEERARDAFAP